MKESPQGPYGPAAAFTLLASLVMYSPLNEIKAAVAAGPPSSMTLVLHGDLTGNGLGRRFIELWGLIVREINFLVQEHFNLKIKEFLFFLLFFLLFLGVSKKYEEIVKTPH